MKKLTDLLKKLISEKNDFERKKLKPQIMMATSVLNPINKTSLIKEVINTMNAYIDTPNEQNENKVLELIKKIDYFK